MHNNKTQAGADQVLAMPNICKIILDYTYSSFKELVDLGRGNISEGVNKAVDLIIGPRCKEFVGVSAGRSHSAVFYRSFLLTCGHNINGQLGYENMLDQFLFSPVDFIGGKNLRIKNVFQGGSQTFLLTEDNTLYACGFNENGQLGLGDNYSCSSFQKVKIDKRLQIKNIICGRTWTCIETDNNEIYFSGKSPLTNSKKFKCYMGDVKMFAGYNDQLIVQPKNDHMFLFRIGHASIQINLPSEISDKIQSICCGNNFFAFLVHNSNRTDVHICESYHREKIHSSFKKISLPYRTKIKSIACTHENLFLLTQNNKVYYYANNQLHNVPTASVSSPIKSIVCGAYYVLAITDDNQIYSYSLENPHHGYGLGLAENDWKRAYEGFIRVPLPNACVNHKRSLSADEEKREGQKFNYVKFATIGLFSIMLVFILGKRWVDRYWVVEEGDNHTMEDDLLNVLSMSH
jgi:hypothetical protein